ncbi:unnamed protein product [Penicillium salamii]|uniref:Cystinosin n=1 Tax=Penicillium salamii TaxID=1612424 RepID=A0A9W4JX28_9EURO|nr:unnamed protein product [Penicillium salamii]CAG8100483.1 unnamed protein product [Penicillium salamii]CAG8294185.1 unnamed protein product [Penicillium salamii]CAG8323504.1 unnamed protein product [Penicillium salamii]CAG8417882.1 unnamed protein product [Penicillium salamii]
MTPELETSIRALSRFVNSSCFRQDKQNSNLSYSFLGWAYMLCWSGSFYPQPLGNWERKSTLGLSIDLCAINPLGFVSYAIYTSAFLYSPVIRSQYADRHPASVEPTVRFNDFAFAAHAVVLSSIVYTHFWPSIWGFYVGRSQRISRSMALIWWACVLAPVVVVGIVLSQSPDGGYDASSWAWIDVIYSFSYIKLLVTIVKYMPQVYLNYKHKSTSGWKIGTCLFDMAGGVLSMAQLVLDASLQGDWSGITGNPVKLLLGNVSIFFDAIFCIQHYLLYRKSSGPKETAGPSEQTPLLVEQGNAETRV